MEDRDTNLVTESKQKEQLHEPKMYTVVFVNDDFTPMDFVSSILTQVFNLSAGAADVIMMKVHETGSANVGRFTKDIAETKIAIVNQTAQKYGYPLHTQAREM